MSQLIRATTQDATGTSIFDPVLCEIAYRWFCPPGGLVLDPFAGGSVRGIVAGYLGRRYLGIDLSERQIAANREQATRICSAGKPRDSVRVKVSAAMARLPFNGCDPEYIRDVCHASCCQSTTHPSGTMISVLPEEEEALRARGATVADGMLQPVARRCPFKTEEHLCGLHNTTDKPFGCIASPFTLNENNTLIIRNRYTKLKCFRDGKQLPAFRAFRASLDLIFGAGEAERVCAELEGGSGDFTAMMPIASWEKLRANDLTKKGFTSDGNSGGGIQMPTWVVGDSRNIAELVPPGTQADFIFSCPPYADLECYSDDPRDLSTMGYDEFLGVYREVIRETVALLAPDRFACFVVGDVREKGGGGAYRGFPWHTVEAFEQAGLRLYNEAVLVTAAGSLPLRVKKQFTVARKLGKTHQNILVFVKGDPRRATEACGAVEFGEGPAGDQEAEDEGWGE